MKNFNLTHTAFITIVFLTLLLFIRLDNGEIQPWDEGLYAYRAKGIVQTGNWWDQTAFSIGRLYSSTYPPILVWSQAISMKLFGFTNFAVRLFPAVCSALSLWILYLIALRLFSKEFSILIAISLAVSHLWNFYSRQGMTDVPLLFFILLSFWLLIKIFESKSDFSTAIYSILLSISFASGLMTKIVVSFIPVIFFIVFLFSAINFRKKISVIITFLVGVSFAAPWHIFMAKKYGYEFYSAFLGKHFYSVVENNSKGLGIFYYINQLILSNPFLILCFIGLAIWIVGIISYRIKKKHQADSLNYDNSQELRGSNYFVPKMPIIDNFKLRCTDIGKFTAYSSIAVFIVLFSGFSLGMTKLPHYNIYMIPWAVIISGIFYEKIYDGLSSARLKWYIIISLMLSTVWSFNYELRQNIKDLLVFRSIHTDAVFFILIVLAGIIVPLIYRDKLEKINLLAFDKIAYLVLIVLLMKLLMINTLIPPGQISGAKVMAHIFEETKRSSYIYMYHKANTSDTLNPQLAWYMNGWNIGTRKGKMVLNVPLPLGTIDFKQIEKTDVLTHAFLLYYLPEEKYLAQAVINEIASVRPIIRQTRNYILFGIVHSERKSRYPYVDLIR